MDCILPKIGTHNSATGEKGKGFISVLVTPFSKCQGRNIASQINMGCRYFDIRFAIDKHGIWRAAHGLWTSQKTLDNILDDIYFASCNLRQPIYVSFTLERGDPVLCRVFRAWFEARYPNLYEQLLIPTYIAHKHPKWTIYHVYNEIPCRQGFLPLDGHSWHTYIPIPWLWKKIYHNHPEFNEEQYTLVDFLL